MVARVILGKLGRPQGIQGLVRVTSFTSPRENILQYADWSIHINGAWHKIERSAQQVTPQHVLVKLKGYPTREAVAELTHAEIAVPKTALPALDEGEYYWHDLVGMQVKNDAGIMLGMVDSILETGSNDVLVVVDEYKKRRLIPYLLDDVVQAINPEDREITVCWDADF